VNIDRNGKYNTRNNRIVIIDRIQLENIPAFSEGKAVVIQERRAYGKILNAGQSEGYGIGELNFWRADSGGYGPNEGIGHAYDLVALIEERA
jgi:hypothetical protein